MPLPRRLSKVRIHFHPSWVPVIPIIAWFVTLWALLGWWLNSGRPKLPSMEESIAYISDIGATFLKPLFIVGCIITGLGFFATLLVDALLRRAGILERAGRRRVRWISYASIASSAVGAIGLIFLSGFDTLRCPTEHDAFLLVFMVGVIFSAIFTILEYAFLLRSPQVHRTRLLEASFYGKILVFLVELGLAIAFGICLNTNNLYNTGAIIEWIVAFVFEFYLVTFWMDLHPANAVIERECGDVEARVVDPTMTGTAGAGRTLVAPRFSHPRGIGAPAVTAAPAGAPPMASVAPAPAHANATTLQADGVPSYPTPTATIPARSAGTLEPPRVTIPRLAAHKPAQAAIPVRA
ncbi:hypothetical protein DACRYDRAFT_107739 [Dacryopinax primogenitus]|uniref:CWH43-like N-terminal domain-containing protein n=1 Tax=Dacryopinax primogenitus (strain DJM 731) TaxID=1858805 RepID=M5GCX0_DACPD|nr:uncharacterized protein DACRYDRAFT_107739 [Dacryopinax primogenitus]EJU02018.1 hypothetical protein DACRYDRAFT_107739 [Dacryopinax primogenitus]